MSAKTNSDDHSAESEIRSLETEARNTGWHEPPDNMIHPLFEGIDNEHIWLLVRRFNKQLFHVKARDDIAGDLDLNIRPDEEFSPKKMRANVERLYMTVVVGMMRVVKHAARLRSWNEPRRTTPFCFGYFLAWWFDYLIPLLISTLLILILLPPARQLLFPPAPLALISAETGGIQQPKSGRLASGDSVTGAPETYAGEAVEEEASNLVTAIAAIVVSIVTETPMHDLDSTTSLPPSAEEPDANGPGAFEKDIPGARKVATVAAQALKASSSNTNQAKYDNSPVPKEQMMWEQILWEHTHLFLHIMVEICDIWERFSNALSATPPFSQKYPRYRLSGPWCLYFCFFGRPIIRRVVHWLDIRYPKWKRFLGLRSTLLHGIPTNAQLTITLLRLAEACKMPIPPPPVATTQTSSDTEHVDADDLPLESSQARLGSTLAHGSTPGSVAAPQEPVKKQSKLIGFMRGVARIGVGSFLSADRVVGALRGKHGRNRAGITSGSSHSSMGPVDFAARYKGQAGRLFVVTTSVTPCVAFTSSLTPHTDDALEPLWTISIEDIVSLCKVEGMGWKTKLVVEWALDTQVAEALAITDKLGNRFVLTAIQMRDVLFNRLISMGMQRWEVQ
ncbi:hypothetical protein BKA62DRAFT_705284 [Auriculariales sp. MPI-PUGE-AT-0066]|nr:hypothetical protein BKA62DRAFT_705284 [Auriculariales sp. MPI-PUGE-AT-0066]